MNRSDLFLGPGSCVDRLSNCAAYGNEACSGAYRAWARDNCPQFCGYCSKFTKSTFKLLCSRLLCKLFLEHVYLQFFKKQIIIKKLSLQLNH